jgi:branched-chain amino acid transport system permease protein
MGFTSILTNALILSSLYAVVAIGFTLVFGVGGVLNLSHGALLTLGAFTSFLVVSRLGASLWVGLGAGAVVAGVIGVVLYASLVQFLDEYPVMIVIVTLLCGGIIEHGLRIFVTQSTISIDPLIAGDVTVLSQEIQLNQLFIFVSAWVLIATLFVFVKYTMTGKALLAINASSRGSKLVGIDTRRINAYTWFISSAFAGFAGVLLLSFLTGDWRMGTNPLIISFAIVIVGGLGSIRGSVVGAYVIGTMETVTTSIISANLTGFISLLMVIVVLLIKPRGLYGQHGMEELFQQSKLLEGTDE